MLIYSACLYQSQDISKMLPPKNLSCSEICDPLNVTSSEIQWRNMRGEIPCKLESDSKWATELNALWISTSVFVVIYAIKEIYIMSSLRWR